MKPKTFYQLEALVKYAQRVVHQYDVITFDLFDTLVIRRVHFPDMLKGAVGRFIAAKARACGKIWRPEKIHQLRDKIEQAHRARTGQKFDDHEARYPDFMAEVLAAIFEDKMSDDILREVTDYELAIENSMLIPRATLVAYLKQMARQGKKIIVVSDMYLPAEHLRRIVDHAGFLDDVTEVVSSADSFLAKASGKAFPLLQKQFKLDPRRWLHIGDNPISDGLRPAEFGIHALVLKDVAEKARKLIFRLYYGFSLSRPFWRGRLLQQMMLPLEDENRPKPALYIEGYNFFAPLVGAFVQGVAERTRDLEIKKIYFFSREGWTFKKFWEHAMPLVFPDGRLPSTEYLYVSRLALAGASCAYQGLTQTNADIFFLAPGNRDMRDLCRVFKLDIQPFLPIMAHYQLTPDDPLSPLYTKPSSGLHDRFLNMLENVDFQKEVKRQTRPYNDALQQYLEHVHFFDQEDVALVDVGWLGTIQRFLYDAVKHRPDKPRFHGFLMGASRGIAYATTPDNYVEGLIFDCDRFDFCGSLIMYAQDVFEEAFRAPYAGLEGYRLKHDKFELVFRKSDDQTGKAEQKQNVYFEPLRQGIFDAAPRYGAASAVMGYRFWMLKPWLNYLLFAKLAFPKTAEVRTLKHKSHLDDFQGRGKSSDRLVHPPKKMWEYSLNGLRWNPFLRMKFYLSHAFDMLRR
jgi:FMN phosphatase YigB (HAD superfamily)